MSGKSLLATRRFLPLFVTQFCGALNDNLLKNALVILVTYRSVSLWGTTPEQMVALAGGIFILPFFIGSAMAGQLADRHDKRRIILWVKLAEVAIMLLAVAGFIAELFGLLVAALFMMGVHSTFFGPVKYSILPQHLSSEELMVGNAWVEAATFLAILLGTLLGGLLVAYSVPALCLVLLGVAALGLLSSRYIPSAPAAASELRISLNPLSSTIQMIRLARQDPAVWRWILSISWFWCYGAIVLSLVPSLGKKILGVDESVITLFLTVFSVGVGIGSLLCGKLSRKRVTVRPAIYGCIGMSLSCGFAWLVIPESLGDDGLQGITAFIATPHSWFLLGSFLGIALSSGVFAVPLYTLVQARSPDVIRSRVIAANNILNAAFMVVGAIILTFALGMGLSARDSFLVLGLLNVAVLHLLR